MSEDIIYVLGLENDCYYVGKSKTPKDRIQQHFSGNGSAWTRLHRPVCVVETQAATTENSEDSLTQRYISKFGIDRVRGGWFHMPNPSKAEVKVMDRMIRSDQDILLPSVLGPVARLPTPLSARVSTGRTLAVGAAAARDILRPAAMRGLA
ncbi:Cullin-4A [Geranomyces variabilis]|nr:Cullin-4A [Geranomyces variabilis]